MQAPDQPKPNQPSQVSKHTPFLLEDARKNHQAYLMQQEQQRNDKRYEEVEKYLKTGLEKIIQDLNDLQDRL